MDGYAYLTAAIGGGAILGGYWMAQRASEQNFHMALIGILISLIGNAGLLLMWSLLWALPFAFILGSGMVITGIGIQSTLQMAIPENFRGRVLSLYGICFMGGPALGALGIGAICGSLRVSCPDHSRIPYCFGDVKGSLAQKTVDRGFFRAFKKRNRFKVFSRLSR